MESIGEATQPRSSGTQTHLFPLDKSKVNDRRLSHRESGVSYYVCTDSAFIRDDLKTDQRGTGIKSTNPPQISTPMPKKNKRHRVECDQGKISDIKMIKRTAKIIDQYTELEEASSLFETATKSIKKGSMKYRHAVIRLPFCTAYSTNYNAAVQKHAGSTRDESSYQMRAVVGSVPPLATAKPKVWKKLGEKKLHIVVERKVQVLEAPKTYGAPLRFEDSYENMYQLYPKMNEKFKRRESQWNEGARMDTTSFDTYAAIGNEKNATATKTYSILLRKRRNGSQRIEKDFTYATIAGSSSTCVREATSQLYGRVQQGRRGSVRKDSTYSAATITPDVVVYRNGFRRTELIVHEGNASRFANTAAHGALPSLIIKGSQHTSHVYMNISRKPGNAVHEQRKLYTNSGSIEYPPAPALPAKAYGN